MQHRTHDYWFPAKRFGWGWGIPNTWQGWAVLVAFLALVCVGVFFREQLGHLLFVAYLAAICVGLVTTCWLKGEPPRWRWGDE